MSKCCDDVNNNQNNGKDVKKVRVNLQSIDVYLSVSICIKCTQRKRGYLTMLWIKQKKQTAAAGVIKSSSQVKPANPFLSRIKTLTILDLAHSPQHAAQHRRAPITHSPAAGTLHHSSP